MNKRCLNCGKWFITEDEHAAVCNLCKSDFKKSLEQEEYTETCDSPNWLETNFWAIVGLGIVLILSVMTIWIVRAMFIH